MSMGYVLRTCLPDYFTLLHRLHKTKFKSNQVGIWELCQNITYVPTDSTASADTDEEISTGECLARKSAILNFVSLIAMVLLLAFSHYQELSKSAQKS